MVKRGCVLAALVLVAHAASAQQRAQEDLAALFQSGVQAQQAGQLELAAMKYCRLLEVQPRNLEALANLGVVYVGLGRFDEAIDAYRKALEISYLSTPIRMNLALAYYKAGRCAEAIQEFARVLAAAPDLYNAIVLKADCHLQIGEFTTTIALLTPVAADHANDQALNYILGMALMQNGQANDGALYLDRILRNGDSAEAHLLMGLAHRGASEFARARDEFAKAVALNPSLPMANSLHGRMLLTTGDREAARAAFTRELQLNPTDFEANLLLGVITKEENDFAAARKYLEKAIAIRAADPGAQYQMATLLLATGDNAGARARLEQIVAASPSFTEAHVSLATVYYRLRRKADGDRHKAIAERLTAEAQARQPGAQTPTPQ